MTAYAAVVLAAGQATRFRAAGGPEPTKLLAIFRGRPLVRHAVEAALGARAAPVILVTGHAAAAVADAVADLAVTVVHHPDYAEGLAGSLQAGIKAVPSCCRGAIVLLADMPNVGSDMIGTLIDRAVAVPDADAIVPVYDGRRGNPVVLARGLFPAVATLTGDVGARHLLRDPALRVEDVDLRAAGVLQDIDLPAQLLGPGSGADDKDPFTVR